MSLQNQFAPYFTERELEVVLLGVTGMTSKEIADVLKTQKCTIDTHRRIVMLKFRVRNFAHLLREYPGIPYLKPGKKRHYPKRRSAAESIAADTE